MNSKTKSADLPPLEIKLFTSPREVTEDDLRGCSAVVVDILRSSATIAAALANGAKEVIPVATPAEGGKLAGRSGRVGTLLCGERDGRKIDGFDLGNSPLEFTTERVGGRILFFTSTNGTAAILRARAAERLYVGGFNNFGAVVKRLAEDANPVVILCAGKLDQFAIEDFVGGGKFVSALEARLKRPVILNDGARAAALMYRHFDGGIPTLLKSSNHGQYLMTLGAEEDIEYCARLDTQVIVPVFEEGKIRGYKADGSPINESATSTS
jgi:2-phosphosulfolactate phosphatase